MLYKTLGQVFTPEWIIDLILNELEFNNEKILNSKVIEPACGTGNFLIKILDRIIKEAKKKKLTNNEIKDIIENNIYGIELDKNTFAECINNLNNYIYKKLSIKNIKWKIYNKNTLKIYKNFENYFDYVIGNPPYIRIHNLDNETRKIIKNYFQFNKGNIDIYVTFFELGINLLNNNGKLGYITPNSYLKNTSYKSFRNFLKEHKLIKTLINFKSNKVFKNFATYTAITIIDNNKNNQFFNYKELINDEIKLINKIYYKDLNNDEWILGSIEDFNIIKNINNNYICKIQDIFDIQYGIATLRDKIFISKIKEIDKNKVLFNNIVIEKNLLMPIVKATKYKGDLNKLEYIIFPYIKYNNEYIPIDENELKKKYPLTYKYLLNNKQELLKRDLRNNTKWYEFGRNQGLKNIFKEKLIINNIYKDKVIFYKLNKKIFIYSGIFITKKENVPYDLKNYQKWEILKKIFNSKNFQKYIELMAKDMASNYKNISTKIIKEYSIK